MIRHLQISFGDIHQRLGQFKEPILEGELHTTIEA